MVLGYSNYPVGAGGFKTFVRFRHAYAMLCGARSGRPCAAGGANVMFRKSMFMAGNGFQGNLKYLRGEYDFLVNKYAPRCGVAVSVEPQAHLAERVPTHKQWHDANVFSRETRRRLPRAASCRLRAAIDILSLYVGLLAGVAAAACSVAAGCWPVLPFALMAIVLPCLWRTRSAGRAMAQFRVELPLWKVVPYELRMAWHSARYALAYRFSDKYDFISHKS